MCKLLLPPSPVSYAIISTLKSLLKLNVEMALKPTHWWNQWPLSKLMFCSCHTGDRWQAPLQTPSSAGTRQLWVSLSQLIFLSASLALFPGSTPSRVNTFSQNSLHLWIPLLGYLRLSDNGAHLLIFAFKKCSWALTLSLSYWMPSRYTRNKDSGFLLYSKEKR